MNPSVARTWAWRLVKIGCTAVVTLLLLEGVTRLFHAGGITLSRGRLHTFDPEAGWRCLPDVDVRYEHPGSFNVRVRCNSRGLRDREHAETKPAGVQRIVVLGDSFMWGYGVENEEMFSTVLERCLPNTETINFGVNGYSTVQELVRLENEGFRYAPDWIVLMFSDNDLEDNFDDKDGGRPVARLDDAGILHIENRPVRCPWKSPATQWLRQNSRLFCTVEYWLQALAEKRKTNRALARRRAEAPTATAPAPKADAAAPMEFSQLDLYAPPSAAMQRAWKAVALLLQRIRSAAAARNCRFVVVNAADLVVVDRAAFAANVEALAARADLPHLDPGRPGKTLGRICGDTGVPYLDLNPVFARQPDPAGLFLRANFHWNAAGHRVAAEAVAAWLRSLEAH
jgi:lysophospholipase L1-like esterase